MLSSHPGFNYEVLKFFTISGVMQNDFLQFFAQQAVVPIKFNVTLPAL